MSEDNKDFFDDDFFGAPQKDEPQFNNDAASQDTEQLLPDADESGVVDSAFDIETGEKIECAQKAYFDQELFAADRLDGGADESGAALDIAASEPLTGGGLNVGTTSTAAKTMSSREGLRGIYRLATWMVSLILIAVLTLALGLINLKDVDSTAQIKEGRETVSFTLKGGKSKTFQLDTDIFIVPDAGVNIKTASQLANLDEESGNYTEETTFICREENLYTQINYIKIENEQGSPSVNVNIYTAEKSDSDDGHTTSIQSGFYRNQGNSWNTVRYQTRCEPSKVYVLSYTAETVLLDTNFVPVKTFLDYGTHVIKGFSGYIGYTSYYAPKLTNVSGNTTIALGKSGSVRFYNEVDYFPLSVAESGEYDILFPENNVIELNLLSGSGRTSNTNQYRVLTANLLKGSDEYACVKSYYSGSSASYVSAKKITSGSTIKADSAGYYYKFVPEQSSPYMYAASGISLSMYDADMRTVSDVATLAKDATYYLYASSISPTTAAIEIRPQLVSELAVGTLSNQRITGTETLYLFIPTESRSYSFYTTSSLDSVGTLYDSKKNRITTNDDGGNGSNFKIVYQLTAGRVYYLGVKLYSSGSSGNLAITVV